jgi:hypothetical protein
MTKEYQFGELFCISRMQVGVDQPGALMHKAPLGIASSLFVLVKNEMNSNLPYFTIHVIFSTEKRRDLRLASIRAKTVTNKEVWLVTGLSLSLRIKHMFDPIMQC